MQSLEPSDAILLVLPGGAAELVPAHPAIE
jgi:hypothetical protein